MFGGAVTFVAGETVRRQLLIHVAHVPVARHLREYGCCRDGEAPGIAADERSLRPLRFGQGKSIEQEEVGMRQVPYRSLPGEPGGGCDTQPVHLLIRGGAYTRISGVTQDELEGGLAGGRCQLLGVAHAHQELNEGAGRGRQDDSPCKHWARPCAPASLVQSGNPQVSLPPQLFFMGDVGLGIQLLA